MAQNTATIPTVTPVNIEELLLPVHLILIDPTIQNATPYWLFLITDDEGKQTWMNSINNSNLSDKEKKQMLSNMTYLWDKYPVKFTDDGKNTTISFATSNRVISPNDNATMKIIFEARANYEETRPDVQPMWGANGILI